MAAPERLGLRAVRRGSRIADEITGQLRRAILSNRLADGEALPLVEVSEQLGVSPMPLREALINLSYEGLVVDHGRHGGYRVTAPTETDLEDIRRLNAFLESSLAARAAQTITSDRLDALRSLHEQFVARSGGDAPDAESLARINRDFHRIILQASEVGYLRRTLRTTSKLLRADPHSEFSGSVEASLRDHPLIIDALAARDSERTSELMFAHITRGTGAAAR